MTDVDIRKLEQAVGMMLEAIGEDCSREGLRDTPNRVARMWRDFLREDAGDFDRVFTEDVGEGGQEVVVRRLRFSSVCEHHLLPVMLDVDVRYRPAQKILGLSKFARLGARWAQRPQVQERFTVDFHRALCTVLGTNDVRIDVHGVHTCMTWRGVFQADTLVDTVACGGVFAADTTPVALG